MCISQIPPSAVAADPVPLVIVAPEPLPGLGGDLHPEPEGPAAFIQVGQGHPAGHGRVVVGGEQDRAPFGAGAVAAWATSSVSAMACASATLCSRVPSRMKYQASAPARVPGPVQGRAEPAQQGGVPELDVPQVGFGGADAGQAASCRPSP